MSKIIIITLIVSIFFSFFSCSTIQLNTAKQQYEIELSGEFFSMEGLSGKSDCYCEKTGFLKTHDNKIYDLCFENDGIEINCDRIKVKGKFLMLDIIENAPPKCFEDQTKAEFFKVFWYRCI